VCVDYDVWCVYVCVLCVKEVWVCVFFVCVYVVCICMYVLLDFKCVCLCGMCGVYVVCGYVVRYLCVFIFVCAWVKLCLFACNFCVCVVCDLCLFV